MAIEAGKRVVSKNPPAEKNKSKNRKETLRKAALHVNPPLLPRTVQLLTERLFVSRKVGENPVAIERDGLRVTPPQQYMSM